MRQCALLLGLFTIGLVGCQSGFSPSQISGVDENSSLSTNPNSNSNPNSNNSNSNSNSSDQAAFPGPLPAPTGRVLSVCPGSCTYHTLSAAVAASQDGDTIQVQAGTYTNDFPPAISTQITIEGVGGMAHFVATEIIPNLKGVLVTNTDVTLYNLEISGAYIDNADGANGAAIRYQGGNLSINYCYFHDNQDGLLGGAQPGTITVNNSEFAHNGVTNDSLYPDGYGYTHNIYVGDIAQFTATNSYFFAANVGHEIKSRALNTTIQNCVIADGASGTASYSIDMPNGGNAIIQNNLIEKGPDAGNSVIITSGEEGSLHPSSLNISGNMILNNLGSKAVAVRNDTTATAQITSNSFYALSSSQIASGANSQSGNTTLATEPFPDTYWTLTVPSPWPAP